MITVKWPPLITDLNEKGYINGYEEEEEKGWYEDVQLSLFTGSET